MRQNASIASATNPDDQAVRAASSCAFPAAASAFRLGEQPLPGVGEHRIAVRAARPRDRSGSHSAAEVGQCSVNSSRDHVDGRGDPVDHRISVARVADRVAEHLAQRQGAVVAQQGQPAVPGTRHGRGQQAGARHQVEPLVAVVLDGRARPARCPCPHSTRGRRIGRGREDRRHLAARAVQMRLDNLQDESCCHGGVEGVAALLQHGHAGCGGEPVRASPPCRTCRPARAEL